MPTTDKNEKKVKTNLERIEDLKNQQEQAKQLFTKLAGAIEILELIESEK